MKKLIDALKTLDAYMDQYDGDMEELQFLQNVLINGDSDIESENDITAIRTRIAQLEKRFK